MKNRKRRCTGASPRILATALVALALATVGLESTAHAQEILVSGPLAGAPAVRKQRLYRDGRLEVAPQVSFTLLDEYQRLILVGGRLTYNVTDWLGIGVMGTYSLPALKLATGLTEEIQGVNEKRIQNTDDANLALEHRKTATNMSSNFEAQLGTIDWIAAPQVTLVPFRGKIGLFESIYIDTDFYLFGGVAFVGVTERADCNTDFDNGVACAPGNFDAAGSFVPSAGSTEFEMAQAMRTTGTFGLGLQFYADSWGAVGLEWRAMPMSRNLGGFDNRGGKDDDNFPDLNVNSDDREFKFNQMVSISLGVSLPFDNKISE